MSDPQSAPPAAPGPAAPQVPAGRLRKNLTDLDQPPGWRGCIDAFSGGVLRGWAIASTAPASPVVLEVVLGGVVLGRITTDQPRPDVSKAVGQVVQAGFLVGLGAFDAAPRRAAARALRGLGLLEVPLTSVLSLRVAGTRLELPPGRGLSEAPVALARLLELLGEVTGSTLGADYITLRDQLLQAGPATDARAGDVQVVAHYLPQFHPVPENDDWWGPGFTEWTNVVAARPWTAGHYQPHLPADLGFYDLRLAEVQQRQIALARAYGVTGFSYYYYWFSGKTLLTLPIDRHLEQGYDLDFCLCWANETWSRRWDGSENQALITQDYRPEDDEAFLRSCLKYFRSPRYIRIDGAPLLQIYRVAQMPDPRGTFARWRAIAQAEGFPGLHICMVETFRADDPQAHGCDSSSQFPPHSMPTEVRTAEHAGRDPAFTGKIMDYADIVQAEIARPRVGHLRFRGAMPSWDNTSRKGAAGTIFQGATPALFGLWMAHLVAQARATQAPGRRLIFVNAWNEWAEGAHLEPDRRHGHGYLAALRDALAPEAGVLAALADPAAPPPPRDEVRTLVERLLNANRQLTRLVTARPVTVPRRGGPFLHVAAGVLRTRPAPEGAQYWLERLNHGPAPEAGLIALGRADGLAVSGWLQLPGQALSPALPVLLCLSAVGRPEEAPLRYLAQTGARQPRPDVVAALGQGEGTLWAGVAAETDLTAVAPGLYDLSLAVGDAGGSDKVVLVPAGLRLLIG